MNKSLFTSNLVRAELMVALVIAGTLIANLASASDSSYRMARYSKAKLAFSQWATGCTLYKKEYGAYLPNLAKSYDSSKDVLHKLNEDGKSLAFVKCLSGKNLNGTSLGSGVAGDRVKFNRQAMEFYAFTPDDFFNYSSRDDAWQLKPLLQDAFGNTAVRVCFDLNNDGRMSGLDAILPDRILPAGTAEGIPGRVIIFTTYREVGGDNQKLDSKDAADIVVIQ